MAFQGRRKIGQGWGPGTIKHSGRREVLFIYPFQGSAKLMILFLCSVFFIYLHGAVLLLRIVLVWFHVFYDAMGFSFHVLMHSDHDMAVLSGK